MGHSTMPSSNIHSGSHPDTGYTTPNDVSGLVTPDDLDLPLDFGAFDDFPVTDSLQGFPSHPPSVPTPHTHHYPPQAAPHQPQHPVHPSHGHGKEEKCVIFLCSRVKNGCSFIFFRLFSLFTS